MLEVLEDFCENERIDILIVTHIASVRFNAQKCLMTFVLHNRYNFIIFIPLKYNRKNVNLFSQLSILQNKVL